MSGVISYNFITSILVIPGGNRPLVTVWLDVGHREGLVVSVALVDAVQAGTHALAVGLAGAAGKRQEQEKYGQQLFHTAKIIKKWQILYVLLKKCLLLQCENKKKDTRYE